jgi:hypothetical protein
LPTPTQIIATIRAANPYNTATTERRAEKLSLFLAEMGGIERAEEFLRCADHVEGRADLSWDLGYYQEGLSVAGAAQVSPLTIWCNGRLNSQSQFVEHTTALFARQVARFPADHWRLTRGDELLAEHLPSGAAQPARAA